MRATIAGITVEGTPQEIAEYRKLTDKVVEKDFKPNSDWLKYIPTTGQTTPNKCPNHGQSCFCTGECQGTSYGMNKWFGALSIKSLEEMIKKPLGEQ